MNRRGEIEQRRRQRREEEKEEEDDEEDEDEEEDDDDEDDDDDDVEEEEEGSLSDEEMAGELLGRLRRIRAEAGVTGVGNVNDNYVARGRLMDFLTGTPLEGGEEGEEEFARLVFEAGMSEEQFGRNRHRLCQCMPPDAPEQVFESGLMDLCADKLERKEQVRDVFDVISSMSRRGSLNFTLQPRLARAAVDCVRYIMDDFLGNSKSATALSTRNSSSSNSNGYRGMGAARNRHWGEDCFSALLDLACDPTTSPPLVACGFSALCTEGLEAQFVHADQCFSALINMANVRANARPMVDDGVTLNFIMQEMMHTEFSVWRREEHHASGAKAFDVSTNLAKWPEIHEDLKREGLVDFLAQLMEFDNYFGFEATEGLAFIVGQDEDGNHSKLLCANAQHVKEIIDILEASLDGREVRYGIRWSIFGRVLALKSLSVSEHNKLMLRPCIPLMLRVIKEHPGETEQITLALETLLELSFLPSNLEHLRDCNGIAELRAFLAPVHSGASTGAGASSSNSSSSSSCSSSSAAAAGGDLCPTSLISHKHRKLASELLMMLESSEPTTTTKAAAVWNHNPDGTASNIKNTGNSSAYSVSSSQSNEQSSYWVVIIRPEAEETNENGSLKEVDNRHETNAIDTESDKIDVFADILVNDFELPVVIGGNEPRVLKNHSEAHPKDEVTDTGAGTGTNMDTDKSNDADESRITSSRRGNSARAAASRLFSLIPNFTRSSSNRQHLDNTSANEAAEGHKASSIKDKNKKNEDNKNQTLEKQKEEGTSTDESMASVLSEKDLRDAIWNASLVILCVTRSFKSTPSCRLYSNLAFSANKPVLPVKIDPTYEPTGWLKVLVTAAVERSTVKLDSCPVLLPDVALQTSTNLSSRSYSHSQDHSQDHGHNHGHGSSAVNSSSSSQCEAADRLSVSETAMTREAYRRGIANGPIGKILNVALQNTLNSLGKRMKKASVSGSGIINNDTDDDNRNDIDSNADDEHLCHQKITNVQQGSYAMSNVDGKKKLRVERNNQDQNHASSTLTTSSPSLGLPPVASLQVLQLDVDDVCEWLNDVDFGAYIPVFREGDVNGESLATLYEFLVRDINGCLSFVENKFQMSTPGVALRFLFHLKKLCTIW